MELLFFLVQVVGISLSGVMAPGPMTAATIAVGTRCRHGGALIALGHGLIEFPLMFGILAGMGYLFESERTKMVIALVGGGFLIWMGGWMLRGLRGGGGGDTVKRYANSSPFWTGVILSGTNPYFLLWWATVGLALAKDAQELGPTVFVLFTIVHWLCDLFWLEALSLASFNGSRLLNKQRQKLVLLICSLALIFFGFVFIYRALM